MTAYKFEDLDDDAKYAAMQAYAVHDDYHETVYEWYTEQGKERGFHIERISYSGFWSQGDGASWTGSVDLCKFIDYHIKEDDTLYALTVVFKELAADSWVDDTVKLTRHSTHYVHSRTMSAGSIEMSWDAFEHDVLRQGVLVGASIYALNETLEDADFYNDLADRVLAEARAYADEIYKALEEEYDSYFDHDNFKELADANDWLFDESGQLI